MSRSKATRDASEELPRSPAESGEWTTFGLYLSEAARIAVLDDADHRELGQTIDRAEASALTAILGSTVARAAMRAIARELAAGELRVSDVAYLEPATEEPAVQDARARISDLVLSACRERGAHPAHVERLVRLRLSRATYARIERHVHDDALRSGTSQSSRTAHAIREGIVTADRAKAIIVQANLRLVVSIAKAFRHRGLAFEDLVQEGNLGLMHAVDKFDYTRGFRFATYATWWIKQALRRAIVDRGTTIRVPVHTADARQRVKRVTDDLLRRNARRPSEDEVADAASMHVDAVRKLLLVASSTSSLDAPLRSGEEATLFDVIPGETSSPDDEAFAAERREAVGAMLRRVSARERRILVLRFGLDGRTPRSLAEIGHELGLTRERVRQLEHLALEKLRSARLADPDD